MLCGQKMGKMACNVRNLVCNIGQDAGVLFPTFRPKITKPIPPLLEHLFVCVCLWSCLLTRTFVCVCLFVFSFVIDKKKKFFIKYFLFYLLFILCFAFVPLFVCGALCGMCLYFVFILPFKRLFNILIYLYCFICFRAYTVV